MHLGFGFLDTDNIGTLLKQPVKKTFAGSSPYAVDVHGDDAHGDPCQKFSHHTIYKADENQDNVRFIYY
eukprot:m.3778 g.3778  ORF g.3778 m.3778 type:complete len:69 (-) comp4399_c0_seq1:315-521(-)